MSPSFVEQTKLLANAVDRTSTTCVTVGIATPIAAYVYNVSNFRTFIELWVVLLGAAGWLVVAVILHFIARRILRVLDR